MTYRPDYRAACRDVAREHGLSADQERLLATVGPLLASGQVSAQVPEPDLKAELRMGWLEDASAHDPDLVGELVSEGYLAWKTRRGWSHEPDGRNTGTGRSQPSRILWLGERAVEEIGSALHALFLKGLEGVRRKAETGAPLLRQGYLARYEEGMALGREGFLEALSAEAAPMPEPAAAMAP